MPSARLIVIVAFPNLPLLDVAGPTDVFFHAGKLAGQISGDQNTYELLMVSMDGSDQVVTRSGIALACPTKIGELVAPYEAKLFALYLIR